MEYKSGKVQVCIISLFAMVGPGLFNALNGLGSVGTGDAQFAAVGNMTLYGFFALFGYFGGVFLNTLGARVCFSVGISTYAIYAVCMYYTDASRLWLAALGGAILGIGASMFWCSQSCLVLSYATSREKAKFTSIYWAIFNIGDVLGGFLQMILNWGVCSKEMGGLYSLSGQKASKSAYITFIVLMLIGAIASFFALATPDKVVRTDGNAVHMERSMGVKEEFTAAAKGILEPFVLRMLVYFIFSNFFYAYEFNFMNSYMFNSRAAGMNSGMFWLSQIVASVMFSTVVDTVGNKRKWRLKKCMMVGFWMNTSLLLVGWSLALVVQFVSCRGRVDKTNIPSSDAIYALDKDGLAKEDITLNTLAWFPDVDGVNGCEYLKSMRQIQEDQGWDICASADTCIPNMYLCVEEPYYGKCQLDITSGTNWVCGLSGAEDICRPMYLHFAPQTALIVITYMILGFSDAVFQIFCYYLVGTMAGDSFSKSAQYTAAYKGIQSLGASIAWGLDYNGSVKYRYQIYINIVLAVISTVSVYFTIPLVLENAKNQFKKKKRRQRRKSTASSYLEIDSEFNPVLTRTSLVEAIHQK